MTPNKTSRNHSLTAKHANLILTKDTTKIYDEYKTHGKHIVWGTILI